MTTETRPLFIPFVLSALVATVSSCNDPQNCPYPQSASSVYNGQSWVLVCTPPSYSYSGDSNSGTAGSSGSSSGAPQTSAGPASGASTPTAATSSTPSPNGAHATPPEHPTDDAGASASPPSGACNGFGVTSDDIRVVDKNDQAPSLTTTLPGAADGIYQLVQATFFRTTTADSAVRSLRGTLTVRGTTLALGTQDTTASGHATEGLTFLLQQDTLTKTCDAIGGDVSSWFFPFPVGGSGAAHAVFDETSGFVRLVVPRADGTTELVFSR